MTTPTYEYKGDDKLVSLTERVISSYTRQNAIADGFLIDVSVVAKEAGITYPVALTNRVYCDYVEVPEGMEGTQDKAGRLWDILWMLFCAIKQDKIAGDIGEYQLIIAMSSQDVWQDNEHRVMGKNQRLVTLKTVCGPDDNLQPCITIMGPEED